MFNAKHVIGLAVIGAMLALMPLSAARAEDTFMQKEAAAFRKIAASEAFTRAACDRVSAPQILGCRALYQDLTDISMETATVLDKWQEAYIAGDKPKGWELKRQYVQLVVKYRELSNETWNKNYFSTEWSSVRNGTASSFAEGYLREQTQALAVRNNFCSTLVGDAYTACQKDWDGYADAIRDMLVVSAQLNQARHDNDKEAYFAAYVKEAQLRIKVVDIEAVIKPQYLGL
ncbi:MAG TPA: hypothetical protein VMR46_02205 [Candidatus Paceibacterota bacterium]|nr:hypothetical protein [Candidatus Paceibacterota bacterium]